MEIKIICQANLFSTPRQYLSYKGTKATYEIEMVMHYVNSANSHMPIALVKIQ